MRLKTFAQVYQGPLGLVMDTAALEKVLAETKSWQKVEPELQAIVSGTSIGARPFGESWGYWLALLSFDGIAFLVAF